MTRKGVDRLIGNSSWLFDRAGCHNVQSRTLCPSTAVRYSDRSIGSIQLTLIKVADARLGATEEAAPSEGGPPAIYSSRARSLVDAVYDWSRFGSLPRGYRWIRSDLEAKRVTAADLVDLTLRYGDKGTIRRIGALLEREGIAETLLRKLERALPATSSPIPWIPRRAKRGPVERRWGVVWNGEA